YATKNEMFNEIVVALGGRVAEEIVLGEISTGAQNDLERASKTARKMVMEYGMSDLGPITYGRSHEEQIFLGRDIARDRNYSEEVASRIDAEVHRMVTEAYNKATEMLTQNMDKLHLLATALKERETIEGEELDALLSDDNEAQDSDYGADKSDAGLGSAAVVGGSQPEEAKSGIAAIEERLRAGKQRDPGPEGAPA
ncbi:MAG TPA: cell division protein FtsH, partial [Bacillota bacterium]|nr:cell division protein FtsH [Bacillota bacterium]